MNHLDAQQSTYNCKACRDGANLLQTNEDGSCIACGTESSDTRTVSTCSVCQSPFASTNGALICSTCLSFGKPISEAQDTIAKQAVVDLLNQVSKDATDVPITYGKPIITKDYGIKPIPEEAAQPATQVGGTHYSDQGIQPIEYIDANNLGFYEANIIKYVTRYKAKNGTEDLNKALWYLNRLIGKQQ